MMSLPAETPSPQETGKRRLSPLSIVFGIVAVLVLILGVMEIIPSNYYLLLPGDALSVEPMIAVKGHPPKHTAGRLYMTDVSFMKTDHLLQELYGRINPDADLQKAQDFSGGLSQSQYLKLNASLMQDSTHEAEAAALNALPGYQPTYASTGPKIIFLVPKTPAASVLKVGDVVEDVDGQRTTRAKQVSPLVRRVRPGDRVHLTILRGRRLLELTVKTIPSRHGLPNKRGKTPLVGIELLDQIRFPVKIRINAGSVVGPSAGLMFSLGIIQRLGPTDITRGCKIAGTGTIDFSGNVGPIGGAKQKVIAAQHAGARYFFVPDVKENVRAAMAHRGDVIVVPVKSLRQALAYLSHLKRCR